MLDMRYPIQGGAGIAWVLVFDSPSALWCVEVVRAGGVRSRTPLDEFRESDLGIGMAYLLNKAVAEAKAD